MLRFFSSLFRSSTAGAGLDEALVDRAIERAVAGTDPRLRGFSGYRKRLRGPVVRAAEHVIELVDGLAPPIELSTAAYGADPRLKAFFASPQRLSDVVGGFSALRNYLRDHSAGPLPDEVFGLLSLEWEERKTLGMDLQGDRVRRDVAQVVVNFLHHRFVCPMDTEADARWELKKRGYDFLLERALERIRDVRGQRAELQQQRTLLNRKLKSLQAGDWGLGPVLGQEGEVQTDLPSLEAEIERVDEGLQTLGGDEQTLGSSLELLAETLSEAPEWLAVRPLELYIDQMGVKVDPAKAAPSQVLHLTELHSRTGARRIAFMARIPRRGLPQRADFLTEAQRYLG
jgi:hypothetical protein